MIGLIRFAQVIWAYSVLGWLLASELHSDYTTWPFWAAVGLFFVVERISFIRGVEQGVINGMEVYSKANSDQRAKIDKALKEEE